MSATITDEDRAAIENGIGDLPEQHRAYVRALVLVAFLRGRVVEFERQHPTAATLSDFRTGPGAQMGDVTRDYPNVREGH